MSKTLCKCGFLQPLNNEINFNIKMRLLHIKKKDTWLKNANQWILSVSKCSHDLKFTKTFGKDKKNH